MPRLLTPEKKGNRMRILANCNPSEFLQPFLTIDITWIYHFTPETKQQNLQWTIQGKPVLKKVKRVPFSGKAMASVYWDVKEIHLIAFLKREEPLLRDIFA